MKTNLRRISVNERDLTPTANLTVNKNRVKIYDNNTYYLQDGQTFEIELYNPTRCKLKADIELDGQLISAGGIVIKPGERVYLERFIDSDNKFVFETYEVEDTEEVNEAISNNGKLEVKFYMEDINLWGNGFQVYTTGPSFPPPQINDPCWPNTTRCYYSSQNVGTTFTSNTSSDLGGVLRSTKLEDTQETGRTEKGEASGQTFKTDYSNFSANVLWSVEYKLLPLSKQPITKKELNIKRYCTECGSNVKSKFKFCPSCGDKL